MIVACADVQPQSDLTFWGMDFTASAATRCPVKPVAPNIVTSVFRAMKDVLCASDGAAVRGHNVAAVSAHNAAVSVCL